MNIQQFKYIIAVAELKNFGMAAERCFITQSTLSTMIGKFEKEINIQIFDRKTKPVSVTNEGKELLEQLKNILKEVENLEEVVKRLKGELSGSLKIGIIPTVAPFVMPMVLNEFAARYPKIRFSITELTTETIIKRTLARDLDLGIVALPVQEEALLEYPLYEEEFVLYDCHELHTQNRVSLDDINRDKLCLLADGHCLNHQVINFCDIDHSNPNAAINFDFRAGSIDSLIRFVKESKGLTLLPYLSILDFSEEEAERLSFFHKTIPVRTIGILTHKHFVKKQIQELLQEEIKSKVLPKLRPRPGKREVLSPI